MTAPTIYVDGDACPVKQEVIRVADRHGLEVYIVSNSGLYLPNTPHVHKIMVGKEPDAADDWIAEHAVASDIAITADILLAERCLKNGVTVIGPTGKQFTKANIGSAVAMRSLNAHLRELGEGGGGNRSFTKQDRSKFLQELENAVQAVLRSKE